MLVETRHARRAVSRSDIGRRGFHGLADRLQVRFDPHCAEIGTEALSRRGQHSSAGTIDPHVDRRAWLAGNSRWLKSVSNIGESRRFNRRAQEIAAFAEGL